MCWSVFFNDGEGGARICDSLREYTHTHFLNVKVIAEKKENLSFSHPHVIPNSYLLLFFHGQKNILEEK